MSYIYASDLKEDNQTDAFMGEGLETAFREAKESGNDLIVGEFWKNKDWEET